MADRPDNARGLTAVVNIALILVTVAGFMTLVGRELTSDRPVPSVTSGDRPVGSQTVQARLWEDPLRAANNQTARSLLDLVAEIKQRAEKEQVWLLPVLLPGADYSEDQEARIRSRFAVVSALGQSGYAPRDEGHIGSVLTRWATTLQLRAWAKGATSLDVDLSSVPSDKPKCASEKDECQTELVIRYEWYRPRVFFPRSTKNDTDDIEVLVLWLDERSLADEPLLRLPILFSPLLKAAQGPRKEKPTIRLIGPQQSATMRAMLPDEYDTKNPPITSQFVSLEELEKEVLRHVEVYSPFVSAMNEVLVKSVGSHEGDRSPVSARLHDVGFKDVWFFNADDARLAREIFAELELRGLQLTSTEIGKTARDHVVLVSEWDTFYGRMLALTYGATLASLDPKSVSRAQFVRDYTESSRALPANLHPFVYLRGLDGLTADAASDRAKLADQRRTRPGSFEDVIRWQPEANKAEGPGQFDYLSRTGEVIASLQAQLRRTGEGEVKAIGIVGSDVYDVLAILQALRPRFPDVLFFTTGLDARLWDPKDRDWSRNLIVASSYGLTLHPDLQGQVPSFRDATQTAVYAATLGALDEGKMETLTQILPRRFEIGNGLAVDLSTTESGSPPLHPLTREEDHRLHPMRLWWIVAIPLLILLPVLFVLYFSFNPFRYHAIQESGFLSRSLRFGDPDVGGPDGSRRFLGLLGRSHDPFSVWLAAALRARLGDGADALLGSDGSGKGAPFVQEMERQLRQANVGAAAAKAADDSFGRRCAGALTALFNEIANHEARVEKRLAKSDFKGSTVVDRMSVERAEPWSDAVPWWKLVSRLRQRLNGRQLLDGLLERLTAQLADPNDLLVAVAHDARRASHKLFVVRVRLIQWLAALGAVTVVAAILLALGIWHDTYWRSDGEPFSLVSGTSAWPNVILRLLSTVLAIGFAMVLIAELRALFYRITRQYRFPWTFREENPAPQCIQASALWREYHHGGRFSARFARPAVPTVLYYVFGLVLLSVVGFPFQPWRGTTVMAWLEFERVVFVGSFLFLSFLTVDAALRCRRFINDLAAQPTDYPATTLAFFKGERGDVGEEYLEEWIDINLIADLTERVGELLWFPGIVFLVTLASLNSWTDRWTTSPGLLVLLLANFALSIASVVILQRAAQTSREKALQSLSAKVKRAESVVAPSKPQNDLAQAQKLLDEIKGLRRGAFVGFWENPVLTAVLVPSGGTAIINLLILLGK